MPFKSKAQQGYMFAKMPKLAKKWAAETPNFKILPQHLKKKHPKKQKPAEEMGEMMPDKERGEK